MVDGGHDEPVSGPDRWTDAAHFLGSGVEPAACLLNAWLPGWRVTTETAVTDGHWHPADIEPLATDLSRYAWHDRRPQAAVAAVTRVVLGLVNRDAERADARTTHLVTHLARSLVYDADELSVLRFPARPDGVARDDELHLLVRRKDRIDRLTMAKAEPRPVDGSLRVAALGALLSGSLPLTNNDDMEIGFTTAGHGLDLSVEVAAADRAVRAWWRSHASELVDSGTPRLYRVDHGRRAVRFERAVVGRVKELLDGGTEPGIAEPPLVRALWRDLFATVIAWTTGAAETPLLAYSAPTFDLGRVEEENGDGALVLVGPERISAITVTA